MKKNFWTLCMLIIITLFIACNKEEQNTNNQNSGNSNTENPGGGGSGAHHEYPNTADVIHNAVTDIDGNSYDAVRIGNQVWMAENLKTTRYADGSSIPLGCTSSYTDPVRSLTEPYRYYPNGFSYNVDLYGYLYNWPAVMHGQNSSESNPSGVQGICPTGWHVPSNAEWTQLFEYIVSVPEYLLPGSDGYHYLQGSEVKALAATWSWDTAYTAYWWDNHYDQMHGLVGYEMQLNNATGFSALAAGAGHELGKYAWFWSSFGKNLVIPSGVIDTCAWCFDIDAYRCRDLGGGYELTSSKHSVRCLRDN